MTKTNRQDRLREFVIRVLTICLSSLIVAVNLKSFVAAGDLFPGGFTGIARLIQRCALEFGGVELPFGPINLALNAVPAFISFKLVGKRFTLYSCLTIVMTSIFTDLIPAFAITEDKLLICIFGGIINGFAGCLCLWVRVTSGGTDFIAIALSERKNVDAWNYILCGNVVMLLIAGALFGWEKALYSMLFQYATTQVIKMLDPDGRRATLLIITGRESAGGVCAQIQDTNHTATLLEGVGLYNGNPCVMIYSVVSDSEVRSLARKIRHSDPKAFVNVLRTERVVGKFYRRPRD
ncbi:MAG: YitT family protein [Lawsonibacter sp.]|nr:YitT family protein [Lawsonibacter sp.]